MGELMPSVPISAGIWRSDGGTCDIRDLKAPRTLRSGKGKGGGGGRCGVGREGWVGRVGLGIGITKHHDHPA